MSSTYQSSKGTSHPVPSDEVYREAMAYGSIGDSASMIGLLEQSARGGSAESHYELARLYQEGRLLPADMSLSVTHLNLAMNLGHAESIRVLGWLYLTGNGVPTTPEYGHKLLQKAAETSPRAMREYGLSLANRREPHLNDMDLGRAYLQRAADLGDAGAEKALVEFFDAPGPVYQSSEPASESLSEEASGSIPIDSSQEGVRQRALSGDKEAAFLYAMNVSIRKFHSSEPEFEAYCWHAAAAELGSTQSASELRFLAGVRTISERTSPGRMDRCVSELVEQMREYPRGYRPQYHN